jgi:2,3-bisphosphoglycerate-independent phosphoglycerate mutase
MVLPDHPTPIFMRTHTSDPVPFFIYDSAKGCNGVSTFDEDTATATGYYVADGYRLMELLTQK